MVSLSRIDNCDKEAAVHHVPPFSFQLICSVELN